MGNPFTKSLKWYRGKKVRVTSNSGEEYEGWVERIEYGQRHVALKGADKVNNHCRNHVGAVFVAHVNEIELAEDEYRMEEISLDNIRDAPYHVREFERKNNQEYIDDVRDKGFVGSFPAVRKNPSDTTDYEIIEGHKRIWIAREAGLLDHPVRILDITDEEMLNKFVYDHYPTEYNRDEVGDAYGGWYDDDEVVNSLGEVGRVHGLNMLDNEMVERQMERLNVSVEDIREYVIR